MTPAAKTRFLCAVDGSEASLRAARFAADRARAEGAVLRLVHVIDWSPYEIMDLSSTATRHHDREVELKTAQDEVLAPAVAALGSGVTVETGVDFGNPAETIGRMAREGVTQVFCGRRGRSKVAALLFGSVTRSLVQACPVPLTVVP